MKYWVIFIAASFVAFGSFAYVGGQIFSVRELSLESQLQASLVKNLLVSSVCQVSHDREILDRNDCGGAGNKNISLVFVGDIMLSRAVGRQMEKRCKDSSLYVVDGLSGGKSPNDCVKGDYEFPFRLSADFLKKADITFGNLEGPISDRGKNQGSEYSFRADSRVVEGLAYAGFDVLSVANNHIWDYGAVALLDTVSILKPNEIYPVGAGENFEEANSVKIIDSQGLRIGFLAFTNLYPKSLEADADSAGISQWDVEDIKLKVESIKKDNLIDFIVVSLHWGNEYETSAGQWQKNIAHGLIDAGADIIVGHHPHVVQEVEKYPSTSSGRVGIIFYSLGNFVFDQIFSKKTMEGLAGEIILEGNKIKDVKTYRVPINQYFQPEIKNGVSL
ncbi:MAG: Capsule synthesis protein, CapA [Candidatus Wolfebacteria bacterium GW2011_GWC1_43_10]|uniref:Capsule synthesis protein, CapA n=2 Tax=Candidatus Wolfeibacteriota TaxID=1752735 RepID=A0A0G1F706_9BACT|nr:MAG: Capsule synthesis protein, CapA [Candidatus Wolfebacteria bacterium GW2011_GWC1_43_10]KKT22640.1 MAG: Capsule synthesis protein, CapA [Parcubacteria group bacterium GW2011_GWB1_43_8b]OGM89628.1 MAG: hypothetical protein A2108_01505 [Candidatus Wolfebacteria bacterium GWA1_42_9]